MNYKAIAEANFEMYKHLVQNGECEEVYLRYLETWKTANDLAYKYIKENFDHKTHSNWLRLRSNPKCLWKRIDWKGKVLEPKEKELSTDTVDKYFTSIFNSNKVKTPSLDDAAELIRISDNVIPALRTEISIEEINRAISKLGTGTSIDGIDPNIIKLLTPNLRETLLLLIKNIFKSNYPDTWQHQLLLAMPKKGHKIEDPKLRGIGIGPVLSRIYDIILNERFCKFYVPNKEQAGFREKQGCLLQIFVVYLLMDLTVVSNSNLIMAFMDYEKAFDFVDRSLLLRYLLECGIDSQFVTAILNMYRDTYYLPKMSNSKTGKEIRTNSGVTQGKSTSANLFSFYVSDMAEKTMLQTEQSFLVQLADDTAILASSVDILRHRLLKLFEYSRKKSLIINMEKTTRGGGYLYGGMAGRCRPNFEKVVFRGGLLTKNHVKMIPCERLLSKIM